MKIFRPIHQEIQVSYRYPVHFTVGLFAPENPLFHEVMRTGGGQFPRKLLVVADRGAYRHHPQLIIQIEAYCREHQEHLALAGSPLLFEGGEGVKNDPLYVTIVRQAIQAAGLCRHSYVVAVGGGALLDMAGYAAATAHRGLRLIRVPTTTLAQADAGIGVKNGLNAFGKKNFIGTFAPPVAVLNDFAFLPTLSRRDWLGGVAEAVKVALIKDAPFFDFIERHAPALVARDLAIMQQVVYRSAALHLEHIATGGDPFESGSSRPLDFGHWAAHRLEALTGFELGHGEAVAIGLALDSTYSYLAGLLDQAGWQRILNTLANLGLALYVPQLEDSRILAGLDEFREHLGGRLTIPLVWDLGQSLEVHDLDANLIRAALDMLRQRALGETEAKARLPVAS
jgi:3-dehydroquinate synthase